MHKCHVGEDPVVKQGNNTQLKIVQVKLMQLSAELAVPSTCLSIYLLQVQQMSS